jgi:hypothetical protein
MQKHLLFYFHALIFSAEFLLMKLKQHLLHCTTTILICFAFGCVANAQFETTDRTIDSVQRKNDNLSAISEFVYEKPEVIASIDKSTWRKHLEKNLGPLLADAHRSKLAPGNYTIYVRFVVEKDGSISEAKALTDPGHGLARGAEKVIKSSPKWTPAEQNGEKVRSYRTQPITFFKLN